MSTPPPPPAAAANGIAGGSPVRSNNVPEEKTNNDESKDNSKNFSNSLSIQAKTIKYSVFKYNEDDFISTQDCADSSFDRFFRDSFAKCNNMMRYTISRATLPTKLISPFRYNFLAALIEGRAPGKRRDPDTMMSLQMPFDKDKFNFTKIHSNEILFVLESPDGHNATMVVNTSPIEEHSALLVPYLNRCLPQVMTKDALILGIETLALSDQQSLRLGFNSLGAMASVNHLHWHCYYFDYKLTINDLPIVNGLLLDWPIPTIVFELNDIHKGTILDITQKVMRIIDFCMTNGQIAYNIFLSRTPLQKIRIYLWLVEPRWGQKNDFNINAAFCEFTGYFICKSRDVFDSLDEMQCVKVLKSVQSHHDKVLHLL